MAKCGVLQVPGRFALALSAMTGWRRLCLAFGAGVIASLALPPLYWVFLLWPAFAVFFWLLDGCGRFRAALVGWFFGFGFSVAGLYWVGSSFLVDAEKFAVLMPFAVAGLAASMARALPARMAS